MMWLALLVLAGLASASNLQLGDRIYAAEQECDRLYKLNRNWGSNHFHEQAAQYMDLYFICVDSLNEDKYEYIEENKVDMSWYPDVNDHFPVETSEGAKLVATPPPRRQAESASIKKQLGDYFTKMGGMYDVVYKMMNIQDKMSQNIVDKQVECEFLGLYMLKHPEDTDSQPKQEKCVTQLNCMKDDFMEQHKFTREQYPDFFPILYKRRGTMVKTPPKVEKSVCEAETSSSPEESKKELEKWMSGIEYIGGKLSDIGEAGTDLIQKLVQKGMGGGEKVLTKEELDHLLADSESGAFEEEDEEDDEADQNPYKIYRDLILGKLGEIGGKGFDIAQGQLEKAKPVIETVQNMAKDLETSPLTESSKNALEDIKGGLSLAEIAAKIATSKLQQEGFDFINKLLPDTQSLEKDDEATEPSENNETPGLQSTEPNENVDAASDNGVGVLKAMIERMVNTGHLPGIDADNQPPNLLKLLKDMGAHGKDEEDDESIEDLEQTLNDLKLKTKQKAEELQLSKEDVQESADVVKGVMHLLLSAATEGLGDAKDMTKKEIDQAKSLVDELVNYATAEVLGHSDGNEEDEGAKDAPKEKGDIEENHPIKDLTEMATKGQEVENPTSSEASGQTDSATSDIQEISGANKGEELVSDSDDSEIVDDNDSKENSEENTGSGKIDIR